jgi:hypothetical protein
MRVGPGDVSCAGYLSIILATDFCIFFRLGLSGVPITDDAVPRQKERLVRGSMKSTIRVPSVYW